MIINNIIYHGENTATVEITDNTFSIKCFLHMLNIKKNSKYKIGEKITQIECMSENIIIAKDEGYLINKTDSSYWSYKIQGQLINNKKSIKIKDLIINIDSYVPGDLKDGDFVEAEISRFDLY